MKNYEVSLGVTGLNLVRFNNFSPFKKTLGTVIIGPNNIGHVRRISRALEKKRSASRME